MTRRDTFDAALTGWLEEEGTGMAPAGLHDNAMRAAGVVRQRPAWLVALRGGIELGANADPAGAMFRRRVVLVVMLLLLAAALVVGVGSLLSPDPLFGVQNGRILVAREDEGGVVEYVTTEADGTDVVPFMQASECGQCTFWSPDGRRIMIPKVVGADRLATAIIDPDGANELLVPFPDDTLFLGPGGWSPDGRQIVLVGFDPNAPGRAGVGLYVAAPDGSGLRQVTQSTDGRTHEWPTLSPDGRRITFLAEDPERPPFGVVAGDLYVVNVDGTGLRRINPAGTKAIETGATGRPIDWSPDGSQLLFAVVEDDLATGRSAAFVVDADGGEPVRISEFGTWLVSVEWSPDGEWLLYGEPSAPTGRTWIERSDGSEVRQLTGAGTANAGCCATWAPDGTRLLLQRVGTNGPDLWTMDVDGNFLQQITSDPGSYVWYSWAREP